MNWIESLLIIAGISLDIFAAMECQGSLVAKIDKKHLSLICALIALWQMVALFVGNSLAMLLCRDEITQKESLIGEILAVVIFFGLGIRLLIKALRNERVNEHREENLGFKHIRQILI